MDLTIFRIKLLVHSKAADNFGRVPVNVHAQQYSNDRANDTYSMLSWRALRERDRLRHIPEKESKKSITTLKHFQNLTASANKQNLTTYRNSPCDTMTSL